MRTIGLLAFFTVFDIAIWQTTGVAFMGFCAGICAGLLIAKLIDLAMEAQP